MKNSKFISWLIYYLIYIITLVFTCTYAFYLGKYSGLDTLHIMIYIILPIPIAYVLNVIIHEFGHLFYGFLSGYKFSSFRIFDIMFLNENGKLKVKKYNLPGTLGQCLMLPPDYREDLPYFLYNIGGIASNFLFCLIFITFYLILPKYTFISALLYFLFVMGIELFLTNGIPLRLQTNNDMLNILEIKKSKEYLKMYWTQFKILDLNIRNVRAKDITDDIIYLPNSGDLSDNLVMTITSAYCDKLIDSHNFSESILTISNILAKAKNLESIHKNLLINNLIYAMIVTGYPEEEIDKWLTKDFKRFIKQMQNNLSIIRTNYAYARIIKKDMKLADSYLNDFNIAIKKYPYKMDIVSEQELINVAYNVN